MQSLSRASRSRFWVVTAGAVFVIAVTATLGRWQLSRAAEKESLQTALDTRASQPPLDAGLLRSGADFDALMHRRVVLRGHWLNDQTIFLDNRQMHGQPGFYVVTPLQLLNSQVVVLVQRGWVQRNFLDRAALPSVPAVADLIELSGLVAPAPGRLYAFKGEDRGLIRQNLDLASFAEETGLPLLPISIMQTDTSDKVLLRDWPAPNFGVERHYGYAFQWFGLCALVTILYLWFQWLRPKTIKLDK